MPASVLDDPILNRAKAALAALYGDRIDRIVLFGSRARGDARPDSDYDLAVFLKGLPASEIWPERRRLADLRVDFIDSTGVFLDAKPYPPAAYWDTTPLMHAIREDGREL